MSTYALGELLGWVNVFLLSLLLVRYLTVKILSPRGAVNRFLRVIHPWVTLLLLICAYFHYRFMWGSMAFNTGHLIIAGVVFAALFSLVIRRMWKRHWFGFHLFGALLTALFLFTHLLWPYLFSR